MLSRLQTIYSVMQTVGSFVGLFAGIFVLVDRFVRYRPIAYWRPTDDADHLDVVVRNTAKVAIVVAAVKCSSATVMRVSYRDDWRDVLDPDYDGVAFIGPDSEKRFTWISLGLEELNQSAPLRLTIYWAFANSRWPQLPVSLRTTVGRLNSLRHAIRPDA